MGALGWVWWVRKFPDFMSHILAFGRVLVRETGPRSDKMAAASLGVDSQFLATILGQFRILFDDLFPDRLSETSQQKAGRHIDI